MEKSLPGSSSRLHYLDWLRVIAFTILIISNSARVFGTDHWWIQNSKNSILIDHILIFVGQWRMPLLFLISGSTIAIVLKRKSLDRFLEDRVIRILIPLFAGMLLVIPLQIYFIWLSEGYNYSFIQFYSGILELKWFPNGNLHWLHLWYLAFIFIYTLALIPFLSLIRSGDSQKFLSYVSKGLEHPVLFFMVVIIFQIPFYILETLMPGSNLTQLAFNFSFFAFGVFFLTRRNLIFTIQKNRTYNFYVGTAFSIFLYLFFWSERGNGSSILNSGLSGEIEIKVRLILSTINRWLWLLTILGYASKYLNFSHKALNYANSAVYPFYILNQTVIVVLAYYVVNLDISVFFKFLIILSATFISIGILYEYVIKKTFLTRLVFGMKTSLEIINPLLRSSKFIRDYSFKLLYTKK
ncbi:MAG: acyltransferase family protein [Daejeonella sp.]